MDINAFKVFRTVAIEGSVTRAAERLNYVQSNVTARIQQLEKELGISLFYRHHKKLTLTPAGHELLPYANKILGIFNEAIEAVLHSSVPRGVLSIGAMESTAAVRLPQIFARYHKQYPQVELSVFTAPTEEQVAAVLQYKIEGAFVDGPIEHPEIVEELAFEERLVLVTPPSNQPLELEYFLNEPILLPFARCVYLDRWQKWLREQGYNPMKVMEFGTLDGILGCIENGLGVTILPKSMIDLWVRQGRLRCYPIPEPHGVVPTMFIRRSDSYISNALRQFLGLAGIVLTSDNPKEI
jgi:DNA-binding transcriptional LysR family regulator